MVAVPIARPYSGAPAAGSASLPAPSVRAIDSKVSSQNHTDQDWTRLVAAGTVVAGGVLMLAGHKRTGVAVAAVGTMVALLDEPEAMESWWKSLPGYLKGAEDLLTKVEGYIEEAAKQGQKLQGILGRK